jgi:DnaJ-domain-containing protein 1
MDTDQNEMPPRAGTRGGFPGGRTPLPRIARPQGSTDQDVLHVESAFRRDQSQGPSLPQRQSGFENYFSTESLFEAVPSLLDEPDPDGGPYAVLGLTYSASWEEISRSHRSLVSELHPDRYVDADDQVRAAAERRVRDVNEAFSTIRRERSGRGR